MIEEIGRLPCGPLGPRKDDPMFRKAIHDFRRASCLAGRSSPAVAAAIRQHTTDVLLIPGHSDPCRRSVIPWPARARWRILPFGWRVTPPRVLAYTPEALFVAETVAAGNVTHAGGATGRHDRRST